MGQTRPSCLFLPFSQVPLANKPLSVPKLDAWSTVKLEKLNSAHNPHLCASHHCGKQIWFIKARQLIFVLISKQNKLSFAEKITQCWQTPRYLCTSTCSGMLKALFYNFEGTSQTAIKRKTQLA